MKLDRTRPFGTICGGVPVPGAKFEQDGKYFNGAEDLLEWPKKADPAAEEAPRPTSVTDKEPEDTDEDTTEPEAKEPDKVEKKYVTPVIRRRKTAKK